MRRSHHSLHLHRKDQNIFLDKAGQSLIEVVIAVGVVLSVLVVISGLVAINILGQKSSEAKIIASNLAREGIEAIRNFRDSAKLKKRNLEQETGEYIENSSAHYYDLRNFNSDNDNRWKINSIGNDQWSSVSYLVVDGTNIYTIGSGAYTGFKRRIAIDSICQASTECGDGVCAYGEADSPCASRIGFRISSEVQWVENSQTQTFKLVDFLYDWR